MFAWSFPKFAQIFRQELRSRRKVQKYNAVFITWYHTRSMTSCRCRLHRWLKQRFADLSTRSTPFFLFLYCALHKEVMLHSSLLNSKELTLHYLESRLSSYYLEFFCTRVVCYFSYLFIFHTFIYVSCIYISVDLWILIHTLDFNVMLHTLFFCSNSSRFGHWELFQFSPVSIPLTDIPLRVSYSLF